MRYRGILFDLDGTLGDTLPICIAAFQHVFQRYQGRRFTAAEVLGMFGPDEEGIFRERLPQAWQPALAAYLAEYERLHAACPEPFPGIRPLLAGLRRDHVRLGVVTAKGAPSAAISARIWRLDAEFEGLEAGSAAGASKPAGMRRFLVRWGLPATDVAYIGDSPHDVDASRAERRPDRLFRTVGDLAAWLGVAD